MEGAMVAVKIVRKALIALWLCGFSILNAVELSGFCKLEAGGGIWCIINNDFGTITNKSHLTGIKWVDIYYGDSFINYAPIELAMQLVLICARQQICVTL